jgi:hypothetical protein
MKHVGEPQQHDKLERKNHEVLLRFSQNVINVLNDSAQEADFVDERRQVVVEEQCAFNEKIWRKVDHITH